MDYTIYKGYKIKVCTRSMSLNLFLKSTSLIDISAKQRYCRTRSDEYIYKILEEDCDFVINIDEDAFVYSMNALYDLLDYMIDNEYVNCGMRDGGVLKIRTHNPLITNPFFNIFNLNKIREKFNMNDINNVEIYKAEYKSLIPEDLTGEYIIDDMEPYSRIFIWLALNFKTLYLNAICHNDQISTILLNHNNEPFLYHSWYSRNYGREPFHTTRINNLFNECCQNNQIRAKMPCFHLMKLRFLNIYVVSIYYYYKIKKYIIKHYMK